MFVSVHFQRCAKINDLVHTCKRKQKNMLRNPLISQHIHEISLDFVLSALRFGSKVSVQHLVECLLRPGPHLRLASPQSRRQVGLGQQLPVEVSVTHNQWI